ncbi:RNA polymerase subunit sigma [Pilimelia terevasa]|uniref:RNA polymerase subunit sigma n=1 Tax=Pilimelia terevasa TaxID=53372 RepID=A0A8J3BNF6_9ACTN|nr:hypothetical protein [Pilimelia terevasa]GGK27222.1 RNA polymerase subunit sigma [Pilimelia terevasa]
MNRSEAQHYDVASYALGLLDGPDAAVFEDHLVACDRCAAELESFLPVASLLADVDGEAFLDAEAAVAEGDMLDKMINTVTYERSRTKVRRTFSLAAGVVALAAAVGAGLLAGNIGGTGGRTPQAQPSASILTDTDSGVLASVPAIRSTDPATKVQASVRLAEKPWGTALALELRNVRGPLKCQLVAVGSDGYGEVLSTWTVDQIGYGNADNGKSLQLAASTALKRADIDRIEVQSVNEGARPGRLVSVDV